MKLEAGKYYRSETNEKIGPITTGFGYTYWVEGRDSVYDPAWEPDGKPDGDNIHGTLIEEWVDYPEPTDEELVQQHRELTQKLKDRGIRYSTISPDRYTKILG